MQKNQLQRFWVRWRSTVVATGSGVVAGATMWAAASTLIASPAQWKEVLVFVPWALTGLGWFVSQQAQRKLFVFQVKNTARAEIVKALRKQQGLIQSISGQVLTLKLDRGATGSHTSAWNEAKWHEFFHAYQRATGAADSGWIFMLEEYEVLFPETAECRRQLVGRQLDLTERCAAFFFNTLDPSRRPATYEQAEQLFDALYDQVALLEDMIAHVQTATLGEVVGREVPIRQPIDPATPRVVMGRNGQLTIQGDAPSSDRVAAVISRGMNV